MRVAERSDSRNLAAALIATASAILPIGARAAVSCVEPPILTAPKVFEDKCPEETGGPGAVVYSGDILIKLPTNRACMGSINIARARNIRITGGSIVFDSSKAAITNYFDGTKAVVTVKESSGTTFIDGLDINVNGIAADAIRTLKHKGRLIVQNTHIRGVSGQAVNRRGIRTPFSG